MDGLPYSLRFLKRVFLNIKDSPQVSLFFRNEVCIDCGQTGDRRLMDNTCHLMKFEPTRLPGKKKVCSQCKECSYRWDQSSLWVGCEILLKVPDWNSKT